MGTPLLPCYFCYSLDCQRIWHERRVVTLVTVVTHGHTPVTLLLLLLA